MTENESTGIYYTIQQMLADRIGGSQLIAMTVTILVDVGGGAVQYESFTIPQEEKEE